MPTDILVKDVMSKRIITVDEKDDVLTAVKKMIRGRASTVIVVKDGKPTGIVTDSDILKKVVAKNMRASDVKVEDVMSYPLIVIHESDDIIEAKRKMIKHKVKRLPVVRNGSVVGILTTTDIAMTGPDMIEILKERIKMREEETRPVFEETASGICESCGNFSENLKLVDGKWLCESCRGE